MLSMDRAAHQSTGSTGRAAWRIRSGRGGSMIWMKWLRSSFPHASPAGRPRR